MAVCETGFGLKRPMLRRERNEEQPVRLWKWHRPQQHAVDDGKNRGIRSDPERQRAHRHSGESWILAQHAQGIAQILNQVFEHRNATAVPVTLLGLLDAAELYESLPTSLRGRHAGLEIVLDVHLQVTFNLLRQLPVASLLVEQADQAQKPGAQSSHEDSSLGDRKRARIAVVCSHSRASFSTCFRPARVSL